MMLNSSQNLLNILHSLSDVVIVLDSKNILTQFFCKNTNKYNLRKTIIVGRSFFDYIAPEHKVKCKSLIEAALSGKSVDYDWIITYGNEALSLKLTLSPLKDENGEIYGVVGVACDITDEQKRDQHKDLILGTASHELKNMLTSVKAYTQLLQKRAEKLSDEKCNFYLEKIDTKINSLQLLIQDMLDMTKIRTNNLKLEKKVGDMNIFIDEIIADMQPIIKKHTLIKKGTVSIPMIFDHVRIEQVLSNMIRNAVKYAPDSEAIYIKLQSDKKKVVVKVQDFGMGIAEDKQQEVFQPFSRVDDPLKPRKPGFGLGLYISSEIIKLHGGNIWLESTEGKGSTFIFSLPIK